MSQRVCVLHKDGTPLMPCKPAKARKLLRDGKAVKHWTKEGVFYIQLTFDTSKHTQPMCLGIDPGSKFDGYVRFAHRRLALRWSYGCINRPGDCYLRYVRQSSPTPGASLGLRAILPDVRKKQEKRRMLRRNRRYRQNRRRKARRHDTKLVAPHEADWVYTTCRLMQSV